LQFAKATPVGGTPAKRQVDAEYLGQTRLAICPAFAQRCFSLGALVGFGKAARDTSHVDVCMGAVGYPWAGPNMAVSLSNGRACLDE